MSREPAATARSRDAVDAPQMRFKFGRWPDLPFLQPKVARE